MSRYLERLVDRLAPAPIATIASPRSPEPGDPGSIDPFETVAPLETTAPPDARPPGSQTWTAPDQVPAPVSRLAAPRPGAADVPSSRRTAGEATSDSGESARAAEPPPFSPPGRPKLPSSETPASTRARTETRADEPVERPTPALLQPAQSPGVSAEERRLQRLESEILKLPTHDQPDAVPPDRGPAVPPPSRDSDGEAAAPLRPAAVQEPPPRAPAPAEPRLVIGRMRVEVVAAPPPSVTRETVRVVRRVADSSGGAAGRRSNLRFGLEQM